jgi:hypothetical protein
MHVAGLLHLGAGKTNKMIPKGVCRAARADFAIFFVPKMPCSANPASCLRLARQSTPGVFRAVKEKPVAPFRSFLGVILASLFLLACGAYVAWRHVPLLMRDFAIGSNVEAATQARVAEGRCKARLVLFSCDIKVEQTTAGATRRSELHYFFIDLPMTHHDVHLLTAKADPSSVTTDIGQQMLWNRAITLGSLLALCLSPLVLLPRAWSRHARAMRDAFAPSS